MIFQNIDVHNAREFYTAEGGGVNWSRMPSTVCDTLEDRSRSILRDATGIELRFVIESGEAVITIRALSNPAALTSVCVFHGDIQAGWQSHEMEFLPDGIFKIKIKRPRNMDKLYAIAKDSGSAWSPEVVRVIPNRAFTLISAEGDIHPPRTADTPKRKLLCYGSSITHGSNSYTQPDSWASFIAHGLGYDLINLGMPGCCKMEEAVVSDLVSREWDMAIIELGINVLGWEKEKIIEHAESTVRSFAKAEKPIIVISPTYCSDDIDGGARAKAWRDALEDACRKLGAQNVVYVNGTDLLGESSLLSADLVHPSIYGARQIGERLLKIAKELTK